MMRFEAFRRKKIHRPTTTIYSYRRNVFIVWDRIEQRFIRGGMAKIGDDEAREFPSLCDEDVLGF